jgi:aspartate aminotransferase-like enzyme
MLQTVFDAPKDTRTMFITASGTAALEATVMNMFTSKDKVLVIAGGTFGKRFKQICDIHQIPIEVIALEWNEQFTAEMLTKYENTGITGMLVNMCETSTGQLYPMSIISDFCKRNNICLVVDAISSFLCDPFSMKDSSAAAVIISSQKGLALNPGMSFVAITAEAFEERCMRSNPQTLYFNFVDYDKDIKRGQTPYTPAVGTINQLYDKLQRLIKTGIATHVSYMESIANYTREQLSSVVQLSVPDYYLLSNCLTPVYCPKNNAMDIFKTLKDKYGVYITPCAGGIAPFLFRICHMSNQITKQDIDELISLLKIVNK